VLDSLPADMREVGQVISEIISTSNPNLLYQDSAYDIAPSTDDNPFYFVERGGPRRKAGSGVSQLSAYVVIMAALVIPFLLVPATALGRRAGTIRRADTPIIIYFGLLGLSFMLVEIEFFHLMALLLGEPTLTFGVVLSSLLVSNGFGSLLGDRLAFGSRVRILVVFGLLTVQLALFAAYGSRAVDALVQLQLSTRILMTVVMVAPIGFCMGMPLPAGMRLIRGRSDLVTWGWAVNGAVSVFASLMAIYLAIHLGIGRTFAIGCTGYVLAGIALVVQRWPVASSPGAPMIVDEPDDTRSSLELTR
jgi:hypothetical protein